MAELFRIVFSDSSIPTLDNQTFEQMTDYKDNNWDDFANKKFKIEKIEKKAAVVRKDDETEYNDAKIAYIESLSAAVRSDIREGRKVICHNQKEGFYLKSKKVNDTEIHISLSHIEQQRRLDMKTRLKACLHSQAAGMMTEYDVTEIGSMINEIFDAHKL